jgi:uncharacterized phage protein (TIGR02220 family)
MKYINIDAEFMIKHNLTIEQATFFSYLRESLSWAQDHIVDGVSYKWVSRNKVIEDIPYITSKPDTVYRWFNKLNDLGVIEYLKKEGRDLFKLKDVCKEWNSRTNSDSNPNKSDGNPKELGLKSENSSDGNPTYSNSYINSKNIDSKFTQQEMLDFKSLVEFANKMFGKKYNGSVEVKRHFKTNLKEGWSIDDMKKAVVNVKQDKWHKDKNYGMCSPEYLIRPSNMNRFVNMGNAGVQGEILDVSSEPTTVTDVFFYTSSGKYWKIYSADGKKYVCQKNGVFEYNNDGTKIPFEV